MASAVISSLLGTPTLSSPQAPSSLLLNNRPAWRELRRRLRESARPSSSKLNFRVRAEIADEGRKERRKREVHSVGVSNEFNSKKEEAPGSETIDGSDNSISASEGEMNSENRFREFLLASHGTEIFEDSTTAASALGTKRLVVSVAGRELILETGGMGRQANGSVTVTSGETVVYATACCDNSTFEPPSDFVPLTVNYQERFSAAGRTSGGFIKREGRPRDSETLVARLIDRPIRPMLKKGWGNETQVLIWALSFDEMNSPDVLAITAAGAALALSDIPLSRSVSGVRVGLIPNTKGESSERVFKVNPSTSEMKESKLDLIIAGTADSVLMIEGYCDLLTEEQLIEAVQIGHAAISAQCKAIDQWAGEIGKAKRGEEKRAGEKEREVSTARLKATLKELCGDKLTRALLLPGKKERSEGLERIEREVLSKLTVNERAGEGVNGAGRASGERRTESRGVVSSSPPHSLSPSLPGAGYLEEAEKVKIEKAASLGETESEREWAMQEGEYVEEEEGSGSDDGEIKLLLNKGVKGGEMRGAGEMAAREEGKLLYDVAEVKRALKDLSSRTMRKLVVEHNIRSDGRSPSDIRPIQSRCGILPRVHGSALFTRGETQALAVSTLGGEDMAQKLDGLSGSDIKRFYLQYTFPPSSVGETGKFGFTSRREIGHGTLAERAIEPSIPKSTDFPYTIRVESTITESNGSSSMASVCGGCLALLDSGVPLKYMVAGIAMGLILNYEENEGEEEREGEKGGSNSGERGREGVEHNDARSTTSLPSSTEKEKGRKGECVILSDILGSEDALGDMDFKVAGSESGVTAFQMDIKVKGITIEVMRKALAQAKEGRIHILKQMAKCSPPPALSISRFAPKIKILKVKADKLSLVIGSGGKTIKSIIEESGVDSIDIQDSGNIKIYAKSMESLSIASRRIEALTMVPKLGSTYRNCLVKSVVSYGCFVELSPGKEGLLHVSEFGLERINQMEEVVKVGERVDVKLLEITQRGQMRLSRKAVLLEEQIGTNATVVTAETVPRAV